MAKYDWLAIRRRWERCGLNKRQFAQSEGIPYCRLRQIAAEQHWPPNGRKLVEKSVQIAEQRAIEAATNKLADDLAPWIEAQKTKIIREGVAIAKIGAKRVKRHFRENPTLDDKTEQNVSRAAETYIKLGRISLGMNDGSNPVGGPLSPVLITHSAVRINPPA